MRPALGRPLSPVAWLAVPVLFTLSVLGLTALGGLLLGASWPVTLSSGLLGAAAAVTVALGPSVTWWSTAQRAALALPYPVAVFGAGLALHGVAVPSGLAMSLGIPATVALVAAATTESPRASGPRGLGGG
ncbi:hypothetical protein [Actinokineospora globicatena]|uniref:hypothetical protein n=1 Tax=Actinokineospora globicatena TaxID=103729 RepID=UPI0020A2D2E6|nr:hypothetical protein [Actinokineospora globicatena]MCP2302428.1 hypothetical protein [Actinokineospora globicatena]GLW75892.1 hypothetical protein Aglo01_03740 [Actinokineospora globicatena]GLW82730.1 hypothetical protein Aglo02_03710 [Actinokineospora globicatena]